jgi:hypothetical protein
VVGNSDHGMPAPPAFDRLVDAHSSISPRTRPGRRKGAASPISSSLAYSLYENQCGSDCAVKDRAPRPGKAAKTFGDAGPKQDASAARIS